MKSFIFIRHLATAGNLERRYIGRTDEPVSPESFENTRRQYTPDLAGFENIRLFVSPMLRCIQTAEFLFPGAEQTVKECLRECDFGIFEGKTAQELSGCGEYSAWLDTGCLGEIPGGDSVLEFKERCCRAFLDIAALDGDTAAIVTHGGVIMAVLERFGYPKRGFYDYHIPNGGIERRRYESGRLIL